MRAYVTDSQPIENSGPPCDGCLFWKADSYVTNNKKIKKVATIEKIKTEKSIQFRIPHSRGWIKRYTPVRGI